MNALRYSLIVLQAADLLTTVFALRLGAFEQNPILSALFPFFGVITSLLICKLVVIGLLLLTSSRRVLRGGVVFSAGVVAWNFIAMFEAVSA